MRIQLDNTKVPKVPFMVSVSGGVDSIAGAHLLHRLNPDKVSLFHYNHNLREQNNLMEESVRRFAKDFDIPLIVKTREPNQKHNKEADLRKDRLDAMRPLDCPFVYCHHLDDAVEGYIMNMAKGIPEYCPIPTLSFIKNSKGGIYRPFLRTLKKSFRRYANHHKLNEYVVEDETNTDTTYCWRNKIRHDIVPQFEGFGLRKVVLKKFYNA